MTGRVTKKEYLLKPGYMILTGEPMLVYMILGSSVAVILCDQAHHVSGCCQFILPRPAELEEKRPIHGSVAIQGLLNMVCGHGGSPSEIEAQVIGGSDLPGRTRGRENAEIAKTILARRGVRITSIDTEGEKARKVIYNSETNHVAIIKVDKIRSTDWYPSEGGT